MRRKTLQADIARALGISRQRVHVLARRGMPVDDVAKARQWRAAHLDSDLMKPDPRAGAAGGDPGHTALKRRLLAAEVTIKETKARNEGGTDLPSIKVENGILIGLQLLRASINGSTGAMFADVTAKIGEDKTRELFALLEDWWRGVHDAAADALLLGLQRELPKWGRGFHARYVARLRGNFPDEPFPNEPRSIDDVPAMADIPTTDNGSA